MAESLNCLNEEIEMDKMVCRFYANYLCRDGDKCLFPHVPTKGRVLDNACRYFLRNMCKYGKRCSLDHVRIVDRNGGKVIQIIQQQLWARKHFRERIFEVNKPPSSNIDQHVGELSGVSARAVLCAVSEVENVNTPGTSKKCANEKCLATSSIQPILKCDDRKMHETGPTEKYLQDFCRSETLQAPAHDVSNSMKNSENAQRSFKDSALSDLKSGENQMGEATAVDVKESQSEESELSELKDLRIYETSQTLVKNFFMKRSEDERCATDGSRKSDSEREARNPGSPFAAENRSQVCDSSVASQKPTDSFDPNEPRILYNTLIVPKGRTAEEIALFCELSFLPVENSSRIPLYQRRATPTVSTSEYVVKQTENAKRADGNNIAEQTKNVERADAELSFLPVENSSRVPLYQRRATPTVSTSEYVVKQTENAEGADGNDVGKETENAKRADGNNISKRSRKRYKKGRKHNSSQQHLAKK